MKKLFYTGILLSLLITQACNPNKVYNKFVEIPGDTWNNKNVLHFDIAILDTTKSYDVYILIRNTANYQYNNLFLFVTTTAPSGDAIRDTLELKLADDSGKWIGKGAADIYTSRHPLRVNVRFPYRGVYSFDIEQALWDQNLKNISDVGMQVELKP